MLSGGRRFQGFRRDLFTRATHALADARQGACLEESDALARVAALQGVPQASTKRSS
jgi:hypothetical protein